MNAKFMFTYPDGENAVELEVLDWDTGDYSGTYMPINESGWLGSDAGLVALLVEQTEAHGTVVGIIYDYDFNWMAHEDMCRFLAALVNEVTTRKFFIFESDSDVAEFVKENSPS